MEPMSKITIQARSGKYTIPITFIQVSPTKFKVLFRYDQELKDEIKSWEGASWDPDTKEWSVGVTERNLYCMKMLAGHGDSRYHSPEPTLPLVSDRPLMAHQKEDVPIWLTRRRCILAGDPGTGKTLEAIEIMEHSPGYWLWTVPRSSIDVWKHEFRKWKCLVNCEDDFLMGGQFAGKGTVGHRYLIVAHHKLYDWLATISTRTNFQWPDHFGVDEVHFFKNPESRRAKAALVIARKVRQKDGIVIPMSGTPSPKDPSDWWLPCELCQPGFLREGSKQKLRYRLGVFEDAGEYKKLVQWKKDEIEKLYRRLKGMVVIRRAEDCLDLPPLIYKVQNFTLDQTHKKLATTIKNTSARAITALIRLRQFSDGFSPTKTCPGCEGDGHIPGVISGQLMPCPACDGSGNIGGDVVETPKDEALLEYLSEDRERIVIYAGFHKSIDKCERIAREAGWQIIKVDGRGTVIDSPLPQNTQEAFEQGSGKIAYIGHPTAGGVSITLTRSDIIVFYSNDFNGASRMQAVKRIHRIGAKKCLIVDFVWLPTDQYVLDNLNRKRELQNVTFGELNDWWQNYDGSIESTYR